MYACQVCTAALVAEHQNLCLQLLCSLVLSFCIDVYRGRIAPLLK